MCKDKKNDYNFDIEEFTESDLYDEGLSSKQKEKIKKRMNMLLGELQESNNAFNINISLDEMLEIKNKLGELGEETEHGIKNSNVLKYIVLKTIKEDMLKYKDEIIDEIFIPSFISLPGVNTSYINHNAMYFFKIYLTKDKLIYYGLSERYKIVKKRVIDFKDIKSIGKSIKNNKWSRGLAWGIDTKTGYMSFIEFNNREVLYLNHLKSKYKNDTEVFLTNLENISGIKAVNKAPLTIEDKVTLFLLGSLAILLVVFILTGLPNWIETIKNLNM